MLRQRPEQHGRPRSMPTNGLLPDAMAGNPTLFAREDYIEEAWRIVDPVLKTDAPAYGYEPGTWGPVRGGTETQAPDGCAEPGGGSRTGRPQGGTCQHDPLTVRIEVLETRRIR